LGVRGRREHEAGREGQQKETATAGESGHGDCLWLAENLSSTDQNESNLEQLVLVGQERQGVLPLLPTGRCSEILG
jgi:hypothetical protein